VVTVGGVSAVSVTFLVSPDRVVVAAVVLMVLDSDSVMVKIDGIWFTSGSVTTVELTMLPAVVGDVEASATGVSAVTVFCVAITVVVVGFTVGTLFGGLGGVVLAGPGGGSLLGGVSTKP
jgi:hypothetical protein